MNLVTGATGLLGSHIVEQLLQRGRPVRALVRATSNTGWLAERGVERAVGDVGDPASLARAMEGVEVIYHAAARVGDWGRWDDFVRITIDGTANMLAAAKEVPTLKRFLHVSSISVYGQVDGEGLVLDETATIGRKLHRWSYYSRSKCEAERMALQAYREGLPVTVVRPSWIYGPRDRATLGRLIRMIRTGKAKLLGDGTNRLNLVYAGNVAEACVLAADHERSIGEVYNCSNDGVITQAGYFNAIAEALGCPPVTRRVPYRLAYSVGFLLECIGHLFRFKNPPMVTRYAVWLSGRKCFFETRKAREQLGWQSRVSYEEGIPATVRWYLETVDGKAAD